jgi:hypothetical protein
VTEPEALPKRTFLFRERFRLGCVTSPSALLSLLGEKATELLALMPLVVMVSVRLEMEQKVPLGPKLTCPPQDGSR